MTKLKSSLLALAAVLATSASATAADLYAPAPAGGMYVFGMGGVLIPNTVEATQDVVPLGEVDVRLDLDTGYSFSGGMGYDFGNGLRLEAEVGYLNSDTDFIALPDLQGADSDAVGTLDGIYGMMNAWYAFDMGAFRPFVGGGIGIAALDIDATYDVGPGDDGVNDGDSAFAWQVGGGFEFDLSEKVNLVARYRYFATSDFTVQDFEGTDVDASFDAHIIDAGVRFHF